MSSNSRIATTRPRGLKPLAIELRFFIAMAALILWLFTR